MNELQAGIKSVLSFDLKIICRLDTFGSPPHTEQVLGCAVQHSIESSLVTEGHYDASFETFETEEQVEGPEPRILRSQSGFVTVFHHQGETLRFHHAQPRNRVFYD